jgi:hypothetical protein
VPKIAPFDEAPETTGPSDGLGTSLGFELCCLTPIPGVGPALTMVSLADIASVGRAESAAFGSTGAIRSAVPAAASGIAEAKRVEVDGTRRVLPVLMDSAIPATSEAAASVPPAQIAGRGIVSQSLLDDHISPGRHFPAMRIGLVGLESPEAVTAVRHEEQPARCLQFAIGSTETSEICRRQIRIEAWTCRP